MNNIIDSFKGKTLVITGGTGSFGFSEILWGKMTSILYESTG